MGKLIFGEFKYEFLSVNIERSIEFCTGWSIYFRRSKSLIGTYCDSPIFTVSAPLISGLFRVMIIGLNMKN